MPPDPPKRAYFRTLTFRTLRSTVYVALPGFTLFTDSEGGSHMTRGSMPMREPVPASWTRTYSGSTHANKSGFGFGFVEVYMQAKS